MSRLFKGAFVTQGNGVRASHVLRSRAAAPWQVPATKPYLPALEPPKTALNRLSIARSITMPILPSEPDLFPPELLDEPQLETASVPWWAMYTMARREKELMRRLRALEIGF